MDDRGLQKLEDVMHPDPEAAMQWYPSDADLQSHLMHMGIMPD